MPRPQVAFDPLDGSSIVDANFAVGSIFGVWPGGTPLGQTGRDQAAAMYSVYGPRTMFVVAYSDANGNKLVQQYVQPSHHRPQQGVQQGAQPECSSSGTGGAEWTLQRAHSGLKHTKIIAPANLRAAADNAAYRSLVDAWIAGGYKLRYSGGMVPDVHHILAKVQMRGGCARGRGRQVAGRRIKCGGTRQGGRLVTTRAEAAAPDRQPHLGASLTAPSPAPTPAPQGGGVFCNPASPKSPAKLRLLYECAPLSFVIEAAGGASFCGRGSVLDLEIKDTGAKTTIAVGTREDVGACLEAMKASPAPAQ